MGGEGTHPAPLTIKLRYGEIPPRLSFFEDELGRRWAAKLLSKDEARPERYSEPSRSDTMPSQPSAQATGWP
jgi:hypothetical protein